MQEAVVQCLECMHDQPHLGFHNGRVEPIEDRWERMITGTPWIASCTVTVDADDVETCSGPDAGDALSYAAFGDHGTREFFTHVRFHKHEEDRIVVHLLVELYARTPRRPRRCSRRPPAERSRSRRWRRNRVLRRRPVVARTDAASARAAWSARRPRANPTSTIKSAQRDRHGRGQVVDHQEQQVEEAAITNVSSAAVALHARRCAAYTPPSRPATNRSP